MSWRESQPGVGACRRPTEDLLTLANLRGIGKDFVGLAMFVAVLDTVMTESEAVLFVFRSRLPHFQFVVTAPTAIYRLAVGALFLFGSSGLPPPLMRLWAGPLDARLSPGHHSRVIRPLFQHGHVVRGYR